MTRLTKLSLANRLVVGMITVAIVVFGALAAFSLRQELLPSTQIPTAFVTASYPGTAPALVADEVAKPLEQAFSGISGVTKVRSDSTNGMANLTVEWTYGLDNDELIGDIRGRGRRACPAVAGAGRDRGVRRKYRRHPGARTGHLLRSTRSPSLPGRWTTSSCRSSPESRAYARSRWPARTRPSWWSRCKPKQLRKYDLNAAAVTQAIQSQALVVPAGNGYEGTTELAIQVGDTPTSAKQVASWPIPAPDGPVKLGTLGQVRVESIEATTIARSTGRPALSISVLKESDADAVEISHVIRDLLPR